MSIAKIVVLAVAGVAAGLVGSAGGITSLISYPALLAVGISPLPANVTNAVALVGSFGGSALGSRIELAGRGRWLRRWAACSALGSAFGVALLLLTPTSVFNRVVPYLLVAASLVLVTQPWLSRWLTARSAQIPTSAWPVGLMLVSVYSGYFGAGSGVMVIALLLLTVDQDFANANALKNMILGVADFVAALGFAIFGPVHFAAALVLLGGLVIGSYFGPSLTRRVPASVMRSAAATLGVGLAVWLWVSSG